MKDASRKVFDRVAPRQQQNWDWRAATNFILGGAGSGVIVAAVLFHFATGSDPRVALLLGLALIGGGLTAVWFEIGRPWRALNVFLHPGTSWMTREALVAALLFVCGGGALLLKGGLPTAACLLLALAFVYCQARILTSDKGIPAWRQPRLLPLIVITGLVEGAALFALLVALSSPRAATMMALLVFALAFLRIVAWKLYLGALHEEGAPQGALRALTAIAPRFMLLGHVLPLVFAILALAIPGAALPAIAAAALLAAVSGGWMKYTLVRRAAFTQGMALPHLPVRGRGPAGAAVKPGWGGVASH